MSKSSCHDNPISDFDFLRELQSMIEGTQSPSSSGKPKAKLKTETLEERVLFSASWIDADVDVIGTNGADTIQGGSTNDYIDGQSGNDLIYGNDGDDILLGGKGNDTLYGGNGNETFIYRQGDGVDRFNGGAGNDIVDSTGAKTLQLSILAKSDSIEAINGDGTTRIEGTSSNNTLDFTNSTLKGITEIDAGAGNDKVYGSAGNDVIIGGKGNDTLYGNGGNDTFIYRDGDGADRFLGGQGNDIVNATGAKTIQLSNLAAGDSVETISGSGTTRVTGTASNNTLDFSKTTLKGITEIDAGAGNDRVTGSAGDDEFIAGAGTDAFDGKAGSDTLVMSGNWSDYKISQVTTGKFTITDLRFGSPDGTDTFSNIEKMEFADGFAEVGKSIKFFSDAPTNHAPTAQSFEFNLNEDSQFQGNLLDGASDIDGDKLFVSEFSQPANGTLEVSPTGEFTYTPNANFHGTEKFTFTVSDGNGGFTTQTVEFNVISVNDAPTAQSFEFNLNEDSQFQGNLLDDTSDIDGDKLIVSDYSQPANGTLEVSSTGEFVYTPNANFHGTEKFTFTVSDGNGGFTTQTVEFNVISVNDAPTAQSFDFNLNEDSQFQGNLLDDASDIDGDKLFVSDYSQPVNGTLEVSSTGEFAYTPNANFHGTEKFTFTVSDGNGGFTTQTVEFNVISVNDAPTAQSFEFNLNEDSQFQGNLLDGASDIDGDKLIVSDYSQPANGTLEVSSTGEFVYTPNANFHGTEKFTFTVSDGNGGFTTQTVEFNVISVNDAPTAQSFEFNLNEDSQFQGNLLEGAGDIDGDKLIVSEFSQPANGTLEVSSTGEFVYTPNANFHGTEKFTFTVSDGNGGFTTQTVEFNVISVNDAPTAQSFEFNLNEDSQFQGNLLDGASDIDGDKLIVSEFSQPANGTLEVNSTGEFTYTPNANFHGTEKFTFTVSDGNGGFTTQTVEFNVISVNDAPTAQSFEFNLNEDSQFQGNLLDDTSDIDGDKLIVSDYSQPANGTLEVNSTGEFVYTPNANFHGTEKFTFTVSDGNGGFTTQTVEFNVISVNDAPTAQSFDFNLNEDSQFQGNLLDGANDIDGDKLFVSNYSQPANGTLEVNSTGEFVYTPNANFHGTEKFTFTVSDGNGGFTTQTVEFNVISVNDAPTAQSFEFNLNEDSQFQGNLLDGANDIDGDKLVVSEFSQPANGTLEVNSTGEFVYTPNANFHGTEKFTFTVSDGNGGFTTQTVEFNVISVNDAPTAQSFEFNLNEDSQFQGNLLDDASDIDGDKLIVSDYSQPANGTLEVNSTGEFVYTPNANFHGTEKFTFTVSDGNGGFTTQTVEFNVISVNDAPTAQSFEFNLNEDSQFQGNLLDDASDIDGDKLIVSDYSQPANGTLEVNSTGEFVYTPNANFHGTEKFTFTVSDGNGGFTTQTVEFNVISVNDAPTAQSFEFNLNEDSQFQGNLLDDANDIDGDKLIVSDYSQPANGTLEVSSTGEFVYTPNANFHGTEKFTFTVSDGNGGFTTQTVEFNVISVNDAPTAQSFEFNLNEDSQFQGNLLDDASDIDGDKLVVSNYSQPANGTLEVNSTGEFVYTPNANFHGTENFTFTVSDGNGGFTTQTVEFNVISVNDAPTAQSFEFNLNEDSQFQGNLLDDASDIDGDKLVVSNYSQPANGTLEVNSTGEFVYTPNANFHGTENFTFTVSDGNGGFTTQTVEFNVISVNDRPTTSSFEFTVHEDGSVDGNLLHGSTDIDGDRLTVSDYSQPDHGSIIVDVNGDFVYQPHENFSGEDTFTYTVTDGMGGYITQTVTVTVTPGVDGVAFEVFDAQGEETTEINLDINAALIDLDGSEHIASIFVHGLPTRAQLSVGTMLTDGSWQVQPADLPNLSIRLDGLGNSDFDLRIEITTQDGNDPIVQTRSLHVDVQNGALINQFIKFEQGSAPLPIDVAKTSSSSENAASTGEGFPAVTRRVAESNSEFSRNISEDKDLWNDSKWMQNSGLERQPWNQYAQPFSTQADNASLATDELGDQPAWSVDANPAALMGLSLFDPSQLVADDVQRIDGDQLAAKSIEIEDWPFAELPESSFDGSKVTAASLMMLFTFKEDNRRKLKQRNEKSSDADASV